MLYNVNVFAQSGLLSTAVAVEASVQIISSLTIRPCDICLSSGIQSFQRIGLMQAESGILSKAISFPVMSASGSALLFSMACGAGAAWVVRGLYFNHRFNPISYETNLSNIEHVQLRLELACLFPRRGSRTAICEVHKHCDRGGQLKCGSVNYLSDEPQLDCFEQHALVFRYSILCRGLDDLLWTSWTIRWGWWPLLVSLLTPLSIPS